MGTTSSLDALTSGSYGRQFKENARRYYGSTIGFAAARNDSQRRFLLRNRIRP